MRDLLKRTKVEQESTTTQTKSTKKYVYTLLLSKNDHEKSAFGIF